MDWQILSPPGGRYLLCPLVKMILTQKTIEPLRR
jgi:hypothetical protein